VVNLAHGNERYEGNYMRSLNGILQGRPSTEEPGSASAEKSGSPGLTENVLAETFAEEEMVIP
jgi:hypothetical protein